MILILLSHQWKEFARSRGKWIKSIARVLIVGVCLYILLASTVFGVSTAGRLKSAFPGRNIEKLFFSIIFYFYLIDLLVRLFLQELPVLSVKPYLLHPIRKI